MPAARPKPVYLPGNDPSFGFFHAVEEGSGRVTAVLMCPPFGWEDVCSYRSRRDWAVHLAEAGCPTLRMDLPGTGDSGGSPRDPDRLTAWTDATGVAAAWLRARTRCDRLAAIGISLGGLVICRAIASGAPIDEVVLWAVPSRGRRFIRELRTFASLQDAHIEPPQEPAHEPAHEPPHEPPHEPAGTGPPADDSTAPGGFVLSGETVRALEQLDLVALPFPEGRLRRALLLGRDGIEVDTRLRSHLEEIGTAVDVARGAGYGAMMAGPEQALAPTRVFAQVDAWLRATAGDGSGAPGAASQAPGTASRGDGALEAVELTVAGTRVRETPLTVDQPFGQLFGILTEPAEAPAAELCALMLNAGAIRRIGPNRMWVEIARRWAARGVSTLRLDIEGLGDADGDASRFTEVAEFYVPELVDQVLATLDVLATRGPYRRFVLSGLCSGAYWSFHGALRDERVVAALMLNPRAMFWNPSLGVVRGFRRGLLRRSSWHRVLRGEVPLTQVVALAEKTPVALASFPRRTLARRRARRLGGDELDDALDQLREAGKHILFAFSENEPLYEELEREGHWDRRDHWPNVTFEFIPGRDHTLRPIESQRRAHELLDRALERELGRELGRL